MEEVEDEPLFRRAGRRDRYRQERRSWSPSGCPATPGEAAGSRRPGSSGPSARTCWRWRTGCAAGRSPGSGWRPPGTTGNRCTSCWSARASTACCTTPRRSRRCPGGPRPTSWTPSGWRRSPSAATLPGSFVPPEDIRRLRTHTRYRRHLVQARTAEKDRCEKLLEDAHLKLSTRDHRHPRGLRPGDADRDHRRPARPEGAGADGPDPDARQDRPAGRSPGLLVLHRAARLHPADDARQHRPPHRPDHRAERQDR